MSPTSLSDVSGERCFPRVSGDEPDLDTVLLTVSAFSPRERG